MKHFGFELRPHRWLTKVVLFVLASMLSSVAIAQSDAPVFLSGNVSGFILPKFETNELILDQGFVLGFGGSLGVRIISPLYVSASVTYLQRSGSRSAYSFDPILFQARRHENVEKFGEIRIDVGPELRNQLGSSLWLNADVGTTYLSLSLGKSTSIDDGRPFWGAYAGAGLEHSTGSIASMVLAVKYRYLQKQAADFGGVQVQFSVRFLISGPE
jgi:hypothetical protein